LESFHVFVKRGFSQRRKKLKGLLPVDLDRRAEELDPAEWRKLYESTRREV
jgi:16S rRNA (adenine1518-N6/adenine1519-N6)-dimethyltransferase